MKTVSGVIFLIIIEPETVTVMCSFWVDINWYIFITIPVIVCTYCMFDNLYTEAIFKF